LAPGPLANLPARLALAFGPLAALRPLAIVSRYGMLLFAWALSRTRHRWVFAASSRAVSNIPLNRTVYALRAPAAG